MKHEKVEFGAAIVPLPAREELRGFVDLSKERNERKRANILGISGGLRVSMLLRLYGRSATRLRRFFGLEQAENWKNLKAAPGERPSLFCAENYSTMGYDVS